MLTWCKFSGVFPLSFSFRPSPARLLTVGVLIAGFSIAASLGPGATLRGQEPDADENPSPYKPLIERIVESTYVPPEENAGKQRIDIKVDVARHVPTGAKLLFRLVYNGLPLEGEQFVYTLEGRRRRGVVIKWSLNKRLGVDEYLLDVRLPLVDQTTDVRAVVKKNKTSFPPEHEPWNWLFAKEGEVIQIGTKEDLAREKKRLCEVYESLVDELLKNWKDINEALEAAKEGKRFSTGGKPDVEALSLFIKEWRNKQGKTQYAIRTFATKEPTLWQKSRTAHVQLDMLARMVSKAARNLQSTTERKLKIKPINPRVSAREATGDFKYYAYYNAAYKYRVSRDAMTRMMNKILDIVCPADAPPEEGAGDGAPGKTASGKTGG